jgi:hypothetical protein
MLTDSSSRPLLTRSQEMIEVELHISPAADLVAEDAQVAGPAAPDGTSGDDPGARPVYLVLLSASAAGSWTTVNMRTR